jgi:hypothetical protein
MDQIAQFWKALANQQRRHTLLKTIHDCEGEPYYRTNHTDLESGLPQGLAVNNSDFPRL